jgi:hypothetical protein
VRRPLLLSFVCLAACTPTTHTQIKHLGPLSKNPARPAVCKLVGVMPDSPAKKAGLQAGETVESVNGTHPADAIAVSDLIQKSGPDANLKVKTAAGEERNVKVALNKEKPRLGASCDLSGWSKNSVSAAGNESITVFEGPYALTVSGILDKGLAFMRVRISNHSDHTIQVKSEMFKVHDGHQAALKVLSPAEVMYFMHGPDGVPMIKSPTEKPTVNFSVDSDSIVRQASPPHKRKDDWSRSDELYVQANAAYLNKESLWPTLVEPGKFADGLIYFIEPKALPVTVQADVEGRTLEAIFGTPQPSGKHMTSEELVRFLESQKKGTPLRLTLSDGKVFVGRYSSYDPDNEIVWFDTPSGILLTTTSFGLKHIAYAEVMSPDQDKKQPAADPLN